MVCNDKELADVPIEGDCLAIYTSPRHSHGTSCSRGKRSLMLSTPSNIGILSTVTENQIGLEIAYLNFHTHYMLHMMFVSPPMVHDIYLEELQKAMVYANTFHHHAHASTASALVDEPNCPSSSAPVLHTSQEASSSHTNYSYISGES